MSKKKDMRPEALRASLQKAYGNLADSLIVVAQHAAEIEERGISPDNPTRLRKAIDELSFAANMLCVADANIEKGNFKNARSEIGYFREYLKRAEKRFSLLWQEDFKEIKDHSGD